MKNLERERLIHINMKYGIMSNQKQTLYWHIKSHFSMTEIFCQKIIGGKFNFRSQRV